MSLLLADEVTPSEGVSVRAIAEAAKTASRVLAPLDKARRNAALEAMARTALGLDAPLPSCFPPTSKTSRSPKK